MKQETEDDSSIEIFRLGVCGTIRSKSVNCSHFVIPAYLQAGYRCLRVDDIWGLGQRQGRRQRHLQV
jgi:hypothetical protein